ncbi:MAG: tRNA pseudouridine(38-40) synthase TruA [Kofleriaceae bacterium]|nr:tRNA pseudouridine(38-40) synthase TruA [Kofleriaceae bacterium]
MSGWQRQDNARTVQGHLEDALAALLGHPVAVPGASRTDAGVHASGQVAAFRTHRPIPAHGVRRGLNATLPSQIAVVDVEPAPDDWHPRFSSTGKAYRYSLFNRPDRSPHWRGRSWHRIKPLDVDAMAEAAAHLIGEHDFAAFRSSDCTAKHTWRRIDAIELVRPAPWLLAIDVRGNAFLRQMVRILTGTLVEVGMHRMSPSQIPGILESLDRRNAGPTAPAYGLELVSVEYGGTRPKPRRPEGHGTPPPAAPASSGDM